MNVSPDRLSEVSVRRVRRAGVTARRWPAHGSGQGPTVVFLAGAALGSPFWEQVRPLVPGSHVLVDRQGRLGTRCDRLPALDTQAALLARLLEDLSEGPDDAPQVLVAHSMAAFEAEALARRRPDLVDGLVLVDPSLAIEPALPSPLEIGAVGGRGPLAALCLRAVRTLMRAPAVGPAAARVARAALASEAREPELMRSPAWQDTWRPNALVGGVAESLAYSAQRRDLLRLRATTPSLQVPCVLLQAPPYGSERSMAPLRGAFARLTVHQVEDSGHLMALDAPQDVALAVRGLLERLGA